MRKLLVLGGAAIGLLLASYVGSVESLRAG